MAKGRPLSKPRTGPRVDELLVERGYAPTLQKAQALVMAGEVLSGDTRIDKAGERLKADAPLRLRPRRGHGYVGRGGLKMESALRRFKVDPKGWVCLDLGMSTGGFTDCLLQRGAERVYGVDVGRGLAHNRLVTDPRAVILEETHARDLSEALIPEKCDLCVADISFNSLRRLIAPALPLLRPNATLLLLVKPQFELSTSELSKVGDRGVVHSLEAQEEACKMVAEHLTALGVTVWGWVPSETKGTKGNQEYFIHGTYRVSTL
jgi:23S rRNA (cytidine1920-2'-O)/16S rRNA (cytidine1409-2'-O)-methyltransferase